MALRSRFLATFHPNVKMKRVAVLCEPGINVKKQRQGLGQIGHQLRLSRLGDVHHRGHSTQTSYSPSIVIVAFLKVIPPANEAMTPNRP